MARTKRKKSPTDSELNMIAQMLTLQQHMAERWDIPSIGQSMEDFVDFALPLVKNPPIPKRPAVQQPVTGGGITSSNMEPHGRSSTTANPILNLGPSPSSSTPVPSSVPSRSHQVTDFPTSTPPIVSDAPPAFSSLSRTVQNVSEEGNETARGGKDKETTGSLGLGNLDKKLENGESTKNQQYHLDLSNTFTNGQSHNIDRRILPGNIGDRQKLDRKMAETTKMAEKTKMVEKTIMAEKTKQKGMGDEEEDDEDETEERENYTEGTEGNERERGWLEDENDDSVDEGWKDWPKPVYSRPFTLEEDRKLDDLVARLGDNWKLVTRQLKDRRRAECRGRYS